MPSVKQANMNISRVSHFATTIPNQLDWLEFQISFEAFLIHPVAQPKGHRGPIVISILQNEYSGWMEKRELHFG